MTRVGHRWVAAVLAVLVAAWGCTGRSENHQDPTPPPQSFGAIPDRSESGSSDYLADVATDGDAAVVVGAAYNGATIPTFRVSRDAGATWQKGRLDEASAAATQPGAGEQVSKVVRLSGRWYAVGHSDAMVLAWDSADGLVWRRLELDPRVLSQDTDDIGDVVAVGDRVVAVGSRTPPGGEVRPMAWWSTDGITWSASELAGKGDLEGVAVRGSVLVAVGSQDESFLVQRSSDGGRTWQRVSGLPRPPKDSGFHRSFSGVAATQEGFTAVGTAWTTKYVPIVYQTPDGRHWRAETTDAISSSSSSGASLIAAADHAVFVVTADTESNDRVRGWVERGARWSEVATPLSRRSGKQQDAAWFGEAGAPSRAGWLVLVHRQENAGLTSEIWRSTSADGALERITAPWSGNDQPLVVPFALAIDQEQVIAGGTSQGLPVVWTGSGTTSGVPQPVSTSAGDGLDGLAKSGDDLLVYGTHLAGANGQIAVTWLRSGSGTWTRTALPTFQTSMSNYAYSRIRHAARIGKRWYVVGERSDNGSDNVSALVSSSNDGKSWASGRPAKISVRATEGGYDVSDLSGSDDVARRMAGITGTARGLVAVGSTGRNDKSSAAAWRSSDGNVWTLVALPAAGFDRSTVSSVASRGSVTVAAGLGWRSGSSRALPLGWVSTDDGRSWRSVTVPDDQPLDSDVLDLAVTTSHFVIVGLGEGSSPRPLAWKSSDGRSWQALELAGTAPARGEAVTLVGALGDGSDLVGLLSRSTLAGTRTTLFRQTVS